MFRTIRRRIDIRHIARTCRTVVTRSEYSRFQRILYQRYPEARVMQRKRIIVASLSLLLVALALPAANIANVPKANAFHSAASTTLSGLGLASYSDSVLNPAGSRDIATAGSTVTFNVVVFATSTVYIRNVTIGIKFDWTTAYQNASNAGPSNTLSLTANQQASVSIGVNIPSTSGPIDHSWTLLIGMGPQNKLIGPTCSAGDQDTATSLVCMTFTRPGHPLLQIWSGDQVAAAQAKLQASTTIARVSPYVTAGTSAGTTAAGQLAQANTEIILGDTSWGTGDYSGAKTHYQNAASNANAAATSLTNLGGGSSNAGIVSTILAGTGTALFGVGGLLAGLGGFFYLRRKPKA